MAKHEIAKHSKERALERYGLSLTLNDIIELEEKISCGNASKLRTYPESDIYCVMYKSTALIVAVIKNKIATFLPADYFSSGSRQLFKNTGRPKKRTKKQSTQQGRQRKEKKNYDSLESWK